MAKKFSIFVCLILFLPLSLAISQVVDGEAIFNKGFDAFKRGMFVDAVDLFSAISIEGVENEYSLRARFYKMLSQINSGDYEEAEKTAELLLRNSKERDELEELQYQRGRISLFRGDYEEAIERFATCMIDYPNSPTFPFALLWFGESHYLLGKYRESFKIFSTLLKTFPDFIRRDIVEWRLEVLGVESREATYRRRLEYSEIQKLQVVQEEDKVVPYREQRLERMYLHMKKLRTLYALSFSREDVVVVPLECDEIIPVPNIDATILKMQMSKNAENERKIEMMEIEIQRLNRLNNLLAAKNKVLLILSQKLEQYIKESRR